MSISVSRNWTVRQRRPSRRRFRCRRMRAAAEEIDVSWTSVIAQDSCKIEGLRGVDICILTRFEIWHPFSSSNSRVRRDISFPPARALWALCQPLPFVLINFGTHEASGIRRTSEAAIGQHGGAQGHDVKISWAGPQLFRIECRHRIAKRGPSAITSAVKLPEVSLRAMQTPIGPARRSPVCTRKVWVGEALSCAA